MAKQLGILVGLMNCNKTTAFGQSTTVTPVQMIQAQSAFFNKGNMLKPWFVSSIDNPVTKKNYYSGENNMQVNQ